MRDKVNVILWGLGFMGQGMGKMILKKQGFKIVGAIDIDPNKVGKKLYDVLGVDKTEDNDVVIAGDPDEIIKEGAADIVMIATASFTKVVYPQIMKIVKNGINVITTAEEMSYPKALDPDLAKNMDKAAKEHNAVILGTGINPGFVMDYLVIALTGVCEEVDRIKVSRVNDLACFGKAVMEEQGIGLTKEQFVKGVEEDTIAGHVGFIQSFGMFEEAFNMKFDRIKQTKEPIITNVARATDLVDVNAGDVAGCKQMGYGYVGDEVFVEMAHPQQVKPEMENQGTGDYITIEGTPSINLANTPEIAGGIGTYAICVNMIPHVLNAAPGLKTMLDLPIPAAIMGDVRELIKK
jgi:2,4-diaminopentanoate dehydrogenase